MEREGLGKGWMASANAAGRSCLFRVVSRIYLRAVLRGDVSKLRLSEMVHFRDSPPRGVQVKTSLFGLAVASFVSMAVSLAPAADLAWSPQRAYTLKRGYISTDNVGCSCDAPGMVGRVCATPRTCEEISGRCEGRCNYALMESIGCSCNAPGVVDMVCATPRTCEEIPGLCKGRC